MFFNLKPRYDSRQSFYGKAVVMVNDNVLELYSYETRVATFDTDSRKVHLTGAYSMTTARHIREFLHLLEDEYGCTGMFQAIENVSKSHKIRSFRAFLEKVEELNFKIDSYRLHKIPSNRE